VLREALGYAPDVRLPLVVDGGAADLGDYEAALSAQPSGPLAEQPAGELMLYSSGTTGRPKGIKRPLSGRSIEDGQMISMLLSEVFGFDADSVYLSPAPMYHASPLGFSIGVAALGGTVVMMEKFHPVDALAAIQSHEVSCAQFVPTMFTRMLKLPEEERTRFDVSSLRMAVHAAAPCPILTKQAMMNWWGPVLWEYYAGTELNGFCLVKPEEWLAHPGTVGKPLIGEVHIVGEDGEELPPGQAGTV
jgi:long-chain acyl-CoA synthetase